MYSGLRSSPVDNGTREDEREQTYGDQGHSRPAREHGIIPHDREGKKYAQ